MHSFGKGERNSFSSRTTVLICALSLFLFWLRNIWALGCYLPPVYMDIYKPAVLPRASCVLLMWHVGCVSMHSSHIKAYMYVATSCNIQRMLYALSPFPFFLFLWWSSCPHYFFVPSVVVVSAVCGLRVVPFFCLPLLSFGCGPRMLTHVGGWPPIAVAVLLAGVFPCVLGPALLGAVSVVGPYVYIEIYTGKKEHTRKRLSGHYKPPVLPARIFYFWGLQSRACCMDRPSK